VLERGDPSQVRAAAIARLDEPWDILVIGGGITGAAILFEAARRGLRALLLERSDFASGASSRSSKLVHGGLRYLKEGKFALTRESVHERQALLRDAPGLVDPIRFLMLHYPGSTPSARTLGLGLALYDLFAGQRAHRAVDSAEALLLAPNIESAGLLGAHEYLDATTDDARLVLRLIQEARAAGAIALNYLDARELLERDGRVVGVRALDTIGGSTVELRARVVINAGGAAADALRSALGAAARLRPLRGSHLILPDWRLPLAEAIAFSHPRDRRPVFAYPWLGVTLVGTTDVDHRSELRSEPAISEEEALYLLEALAYQFPRSAIERTDVVATFAGVRPVIHSGRADPSKESRDHALWKERGLLTVTGGKLTTFRPMALAALRAVAGELDAFDLAPRPTFVRCALPHAPHLSQAQRLRLAGSYGSEAQALLDTTLPSDRESVDGTATLWAEVRWAARHESVEHLDDLLLRRTRLGLIAPTCDRRWSARLRSICMQELRWDDARFEREAHAYRALHAAYYGALA